MRYYKKIEIDNLEIIQAKVLDFVKNQHPEIYAHKGKSSFNHLNVEKLKSACPELIESFDALGLTIVFAATHIMYNKLQAGIHIDNVPWKARINIPILNCVGSRTAFYTGEKTQTEIVTMENGNTYSVTAITNSEECVEVDSYELTQPLVLRVNVPHKVFMNVSTPPRIALTIGCNPDPVFILEESTTPPAL